MIAHLQERLDFCEAHQLDNMGDWIARQISEHLDGGTFGAADFPPCDGNCGRLPGMWRTPQPYDNNDGPIQATHAPTGARMAQ